MTPKVYLKILLLSLILVGLTPFVIPTTIEHLDELHKVQFGAPLHFIEQIPTLSPSEKDLPLRLIVLSPWQHPTQILWGNLLISIIFVNIVMLASIKLFKKLFKN